MTAVDAVAGVIVWVYFSGPVARAPPASWNVPERIAAATLRLDRWEAGAVLVRANRTKAGGMSRGGDDQETSILSAHRGDFRTLTEITTVNSIVGK